MMRQPPHTLLATDPPELHTSLRLERDVERHYGTWATGGGCRIRIFTAPGRTPVVLCSQIRARPNWCISAVVEHLAASTVARYLPQRFDEAEPVIWLEHYPLDPARQRRGAGQLDLARVTFSHWRPLVEQRGSLREVRIGEPTWQPLTPAEVTTLLGPQPDLML